jgi:hypothetical protein
MSDLSDIRDGFATVVGAISGLRVYAYEPDGVREYPCIVVEPIEDMSYQEGAGDRIETDFELASTLYVQSHSSAAGWQELDKYRSPTGSESVIAKIRGDRTLDGSCDFAWLTGVGAGERDRDDNDRFWEFSCQFRCRVSKAITS